jgi:membrane protease subunit HflK
MPWKEPGKGDKDPWSSGGQQPPDLEEVFRNLSNRLRALFGGGSRGRRSEGSSANGGGSSMFAILIVAALLWAGWDAVHIIDEAEQGVVLRFGAYNRTLSPGINLTLPRPLESMFKVNVSSVRSLEDSANMLTEDENLVEFNYRVQFRVADPQDFLFRVRDPESTVRDAAESALRESVGTNRLDAILEGTQREQVRLETFRVLQETLDRYQAGVLVTQFNFTDVNVPAQVREAYSDVIRAREDRERFIEEAGVHANSVVPEARGQAARVLQEAEGYKAATVALARWPAPASAGRIRGARIPWRLYLNHRRVRRSRKVLRSGEQRQRPVPAAGPVDRRRRPDGDAAGRCARRRSRCRQPVTES